MDWDLLYYALYGFISGLGELLPVSPTAHGHLIQLLTRFDTRQPAMLLCIHFACFLAIAIRYREKIGHIRRELKICKIPKKDRKRNPDEVAVADGKLLRTCMIPVAVLVGLSALSYDSLAKLPWLCLFLLASGIVLYLPQFLPGANKDGRSLSRRDGVILGSGYAISVVPGFSGIGNMISVGLMCGCDIGYICNIAMLLSMPMLLGLMILDGILLIMAGTVITGIAIVYLALAAVTAFVGALFAMEIMEYLSMRSNFYGFAYYNWGLALFGFLVYLMI